MASALSRSLQIKKSAAELFRRLRQAMRCFAFKGELN